jgi:hypothetical protein
LAWSRRLLVVGVAGSEGGGESCGGDGVAVFVDEPVVDFAQGEEVVEGGWAAVGPPGDVVDVAARQRGVAVGVAAGGVHGGEGGVLGGGGVAGGAADVEDLPGGVGEDAGQDGVAAQPLDGGGGDAAEPAQQRPAPSTPVSWSRVITMDRWGVVRPWRGRSPVSTPEAMRALNASARRWCQVRSSP